MEGRRRYRGDNYNQEVPKVNRKPSVGDWQQTVPTWEKKFCTSICKVPWNKIVDAKKYLPCHDNVVNWDDSAGKEAFDNAKMRYYATMHGLPCEIEMPGPDKYIDDIDWDCQTDQNLLLDLAKKPGDLDTVRKCENIVIFGDTFLQDQGFSSTGWGDGVEELKEIPNSSNVNGDKPWEHQFSPNNGPVEGNAWTHSGYNSWGWYNNNEAPMGGYGWGDGGGCSGPSGWGDGWNGWYGYGNNHAQEHDIDPTLDPNAIYGGGWTFEDIRKGDGKRMPKYNGCTPGHIGYMPEDDIYRPSNNNYVPRHETSRFYGTNYGANQSRMNADTARNRVNFVPEQPTANQWNTSKGKFTTSCAPVVSQVSCKARNWSMEKPVS